MLTLLVYLLIAALIFGIVWWVLQQILLPQPIRMVVVVVMALIAVVFLLEAVGGLGGIGHLGRLG